MHSATLQQDDLKWLVCPVCRGVLTLEAGSVRCAGCGRLYPIVDGIVVLLAERSGVESGRPTWICTDIGARH
jgi:uncharacterized protein